MGNYLLIVKAWIKSFFFFSFPLQVGLSDPRRRNEVYWLTACSPWKYCLNLPTVAHLACACKGGLNSPKTERLEGHKSCNGSGMWAKRLHLGISVEGDRCPSHYMSDDNKQNFKDSVAHLFIYASAEVPYKHDEVNTKCN